MNRHVYFRQQEKNYLMHHGILGQKWGIRRFQNKDGSLTEAGKKRYGYNDTNTWSTNLQRKNAQRRTDYINQFNKDNKGHKFGPSDEQALLDQYMIDNGESLGEKLYYQDKTASEVVDAIDNKKYTDDVREIDQDYRKWANLALNETSGIKLNDYNFPDKEHLNDFYMKYVDPEGYKKKKEKEEKEDREYIKDYEKDFKEFYGNTYEKEKNGISYRLDKNSSVKAIKTLKYTEENHEKLKKQWDEEIYTYLKDEMGHWLVDDNGKMPSKKEILDNITLETIDTGIGKDDYVTVWYGDKSPKWMLGGHVIDFDYRIGDENKKDKYVDYRFEG